MRIVHFGSGNIGRGAIPEIFYGLYDELIFIDPNPVIIKQLNAEREYQIINDKKLIINKYRGIDGSDESAILDALKNADIISTSCGINNLQSVANMLNKLTGLSKHPYVIAFENNVRPSSHLKQMVKQPNNFVFLDCTIDRIVPKQVIGKNVLDVHTEAYLAVVIENKAKIRHPQWFVNAQLVDDLEKHISLKLFGVNGLHFVVAVLGHANSLRFVHEVFDKHPQIINSINVYIDCLEHFLVKNYNFKEDYINTYLKKNLKRFSNVELNDECVRIARNALLKLSPDNRVVPVIKFCMDSNDCSNAERLTLIDILKKLVTYNNPEDNDSIKLQELISKQGLQVTIKQITGLSIKE